MIINLFREKNSNVLLGTYFLKCVILPIRLCIPVQQILLLTLPRQRKETGIANDDLIRLLVSCMCFSKATKKLNGKVAWYFHFILSLFFCRTNLIKKLI